MNVFTIYNPEDFHWNDKYVQFSDSAKFHLEEFGLDALEIMDMLRDPINCPKSNKFRRKDIEICSKKNKRIFRITLFEDYCFDVKDFCWCIKHVKPT